MIIKTKGIVLRSMKYRDNSLIADIFTENHGLRSYIVNGVYSKNGVSKNAYFQALNILDLVAYEREELQLNRIKEMKMVLNINFHHFNIVKASLSIFMAEVLRNILKEKISSLSIFKRTEELIQELNQLAGNVSLFPHYLLLTMTHELGIQPQGRYSESRAFFDMREGVFTSLEPIHHDFTEPELSKLTSMILEDESQYKSLQISKQLRQRWLEKLIRYFELHVSQFKELKSLEVLSQVLN
jgi:DNA repair protein RecO (recombination protein O)